MASRQNNLEKISITVTGAEGGSTVVTGEEGGLSPRFGEKEVHEALETVGKHGKSHHQYMKVMAQHKAVAEMRKISLKELGEHHAADSAWLSLNGIVYDVTVYLHFHPGGDIILKGCGKECSALFSKLSPMQTPTTPGSTPNTSSPSTPSASSPPDCPSSRTHTRLYS